MAVPPPHARRPPSSVADYTLQLSVRLDTRIVTRIDNVRARAKPIAWMPMPSRVEILRIALSLGLEVLEREQGEGR